MPTKDEAVRDSAEFQKAFDEADPEKKEPTEDEAFGLTPEEEPGETEGGSAPAVAIVVEDTPPGGGEPQATPDSAEPAPTAEAAPVVEAPAGAEAPAPGAEAAPAAAEPAAAPPLDVEKETQRLKSWEGRLKAREAELNAKGAAPATEAGAEESPEEEAGETPDEESAETAGTGISAADAEKKLAEDFGDEFVSMIKAISMDAARSVAGEVASQGVGEVKGTVQQIIDDLTDSKARAHFEKIAEKYPNFMDIAADPAFRAWVEALPDPEKEETKRIVNGGTAKEVLGVLDKFTAQSASAAEPAAPQGEEAPAPAPAPTDNVSDDELAAAEGVRSSGLVLPETPELSGDYQKAWDEFK